jgi:hypothetical protein
VPTLTVEDDELVVGLTGLERLAAFHFSAVRFPLATISEVAVEPDVWKALRGIRAPGTGIPGVIAYGTRRCSGGRDLVFVTGGHRPGLRVDFGEGAPYARLVISSADPQEQAELVRRAQRGH